VEDQGKIKPQQKQASRLTLTIFAVPDAIEKSPATAMYMQPLEGIETGNERRSPLPFPTLNKRSHLQNTKRDLTKCDRRCLRQKAVSTSASSLKFLNFFNS